MAQSIYELENVLQSLLTEHRRLLDLLQTHHAAMRSMSMEQLGPSAEGIQTSRARLMMLESRRRVAVAQLGKELKAASPPTLSMLAEAFPQRRPFLLKTRQDLREVTSAITRQTAVSSRVAGALLGHLNTVVRLVAGAVRQAGVYTRTGSPSLSARIGGIEAVG